MPVPPISLLRRAEDIGQYTDAQRSLTDNAQASPFKRSLLRAINTDVAGAHQQELLEAQVQGDKFAEQAAQHYLKDPTTRLTLPTVGAQTWGEARETGEYGDYIANTLGSAAGSMAKPILASAAGGLLGPLGAAAGAYGGSYSSIRNSELMGYEGDEQLAGMTPQEKLDMSRKSSALQAAPEAILPTYLGMGGRLPGALARIPTAGRIAGEVATEAGTEGLQDYIGQRVAQEKFPDRQTDWESIKESAIAGGIAGGGFGLVGSHNTPTAPERTDGIPLMDRARTALDGAKDFVSEQAQGIPLGAAGDAVTEVASQAADGLKGFVQRAQDRSQYAASKGEAVANIFGMSTYDQAAADLRPETEAPEVLSATDPAAAMEQRAAEITRRTAERAQTVLNDTTGKYTDGMKQAVANMGGDFASEANQQMLANTVLSVEGGEKTMRAIRSLVESAKGWSEKMTGTDSGGVSKKNMQDIPLLEIKPIIDMLAPLMGNQNADKVESLARQLSAVAARLTPEGALPTAVAQRLMSLNEAVGPEVIDQLGEVLKAPGFAQAIARVRGIPSAAQDMRDSKGSSFLESMLTKPVTPQERVELGKVIDTFSNSFEKTPEHTREKALNLLATHAFGDVKRAQTVVDYYSRMRTQAMNSEFGDQALDQGEVNEDTGETEGSDFGVLTEQDAPRVQGHFRAPNPARPFFIDPEVEGNDKAALRVKLRELGNGAKTVTMREYAERTGESPQVLAAQVRNDLRKRIIEAQNRDTGYVQNAIAALEATPAEKRSKDHNTLLASLKDRKTTDRPDLPAMVAQGEIIGKAAGVTFADVTDMFRRVRRAELDADKKLETADVKNLPQLRKQLDEMEALFAESAPKVLEKYHVPITMEDDALLGKGKIRGISDDTVQNKFRALLDKKKAPPKRRDGENQSDFNERLAEVKKYNEKLLKTRIGFRMKGKAAPLYVSAEAMVYNSPNKYGTPAQRLAEAISGMLLRADVADLVPPSPGTIVIRREDDNDLTWGDISPEMPAFPSDAKRAEVADKNMRAAIGKEKRAVADFHNRKGMESAILDVQRAALIEQLSASQRNKVPSEKDVKALIEKLPRGEDATFAQKARAELEAIISLFPANQRPRLREESADLAFQTAKKWAFALQRKSDSHNTRTSEAKETMYKEQSKLRVIEEFLSDALDDKFPKPDPREGETRLSEAEEESGAQGPEAKNVAADVLTAEATLDVLKARMDAVKGVHNLVNELKRRIEFGEKNLDALTNSVRRDQRERGVAGRRDDAKFTSPKEAPSPSPQRTGSAPKVQYDEREGTNAQLRAWAQKASLVELEAKIKEHSQRLDRGVRDEALSDLMQDELSMFEAALRKREAELRALPPPKLEGSGPHHVKDQAKSDKANKFIGRGVAGSSTDNYAKAWGERANTGRYTAKDRVFISANGRRAGALTPNFAEIGKAVKAGATIIADNSYDRSRDFNVGERSVADFLARNGYEESRGNGIWTPEKGDGPGGVRKNSFVGAKADPEGAAKAGAALDAGQSADFVWSTLGWFRGPDGKLRKEIRSPVLRARLRNILSPSEANWKQRIAAKLRGKPEPGANYAAGNSGVYRSFPASALFEGIPGFENLLPQLKGVQVKALTSIDEGYAGAYSPEDKTLTIGVGDSSVVPVLAELLGGYDALTDALSQLSSEPGSKTFTEGGSFLGMAEELYRYGKIKETPAQVADMVMDAVVETAMHELQHALQHIEGFENGGSSKLAVVAKFGDLKKFQTSLDSGDIVGAERQLSAAFSAMRAFYGPNASIEEMAHHMYKDIIGEAEAFDVEARLKLSDAEAKNLKPALMSKERDFLRSLAVEAFKSGAFGRIAKERDDGSFSEPDFGNEDFPAEPKLRDWKGRTNDDGSFSEPKSSTKGDTNPNNATEAEKKAARDEVLRTRGPKVKVLIEKLVSELGGSGQYDANAKRTKRLIQIAINAGDMLGTARHEALHDLFAMLGEDKASRSIKRDLIDAANAPHVKKQLRKLLEKHPAALEQIKNDPEERVAYMYQFWAAGELELGPTGTKVFTKIRQFLNDVFKIVTAGQRAEDLLQQFHSGEFVDTSVVSEVLADLPRERMINRMERMAPSLVDVTQKLMHTAPDRLRAFQNDKLNELADRFSSEKGKLGLIQKRLQQEGVWSNKLAGIFKGTNSKERRAALDNLQAMKAPSSPLERQLDAHFKAMHAYMTKAGVKTLDGKTNEWVPIRQVGQYFPRVFDRREIEKDREGFVQLLMKEGNMSLRSANATVNAMVHGSGQLDLAENEHALGYSPYAQSVQDRSLTFITPKNAALFAKYQSKDLADITTGYVKQVVHRAEYAREFGNRGEEITKLISASKITDPKDLADISKIVLGLEGTLGHDMSPATKELMSGIMTLQNITLLPLAIFSQMVDPVVLAARSGELGDIGKAFSTAIKRLFKAENVDGEDIAQMLGIITDDSVLDAMGATYGSMYMSQRMRNINRTFFKYNGMQGWNNSMRIAASAAGERYLIQNRKNVEALAELGLEPKDIQMISSFHGKPDAGGKVVARERLDFSNPKIKEAMFRFVDGAVIRPSASNRPVWMSDPKFMLVGHLKQFTFAMHNVILKRANLQLDEGNVKPWATLALALPMILAADMTKFATLGTTPPGWEFKDYIVHAVERSGLLGTGDFMAQATKGDIPGLALLGPAVENLMEILRWGTGDPTVGLGDVVDRTVPGARFL